MGPMNGFYVPTKIFSGEAAFENLKQYPIHRMCIICDPFIEKSGMIKKLLRVVEEMGAESPHLFGYHAGSEHRSGGARADPHSRS